MRFLKIAVIVAATMTFAAPSRADHFTQRYGDGPDIEVWTNKGYDSQYYYGEDIAVYFRAETDCYVVVYDIDPSGEVAVLFPSNYYNSAYVNGGQVYRIPDYYSDYTLEVSGRSGTEHIFAVATYEYLNPPDFLPYVGYDYGDRQYYDDDYFVSYLRGDLDDFVNFVNNRMVSGPHSVAYTRFQVQSNYRHHRHYRYWDLDPYYSGSVWIGCNFPGAEIWIDGIYYGIAPILVPRIFIGYHWVWVYYGGYPCYQRYFYVYDTDRYYIDVRVDDGYKDYRYRRNSFNGWHPLEKRYRNEDGFEKRARDARVGKVTEKRSLPAHVIRDFDQRGVISKDAPIARKARAEFRVDDGLRMQQKRDTRAGIEARSKEEDRERKIEKNAADLKGRDAELRDRSIPVDIYDGGRDKVDGNDRARGIRESEQSKSEEKSRSKISVKSDDKKPVKSKEADLRKSKDSSSKSDRKSISRQKSKAPERSSGKSSSGKEKRR